MELQVACVGLGPDLFFSETISEIAMAKSICEMCSMKEQCLSDALARREPFGVWGAELFFEGAIVAVKRPRGRPRKDAPVILVSAALARAAEAAEAVSALDASIENGDVMIDDDRDVSVCVESAAA